MDETRNDRAAMFAYLRTCDSVVKLSVGAVIGGIVRHDYVVVHEAPPRVVQEIVHRFRHVALRTDGLLIPLTPECTERD